jgi:hypothetical protein
MRTHTTTTPTRLRARKGPPAPPRPAPAGRRARFRLRHPTLPQLQRAIADVCERGYEGAGAAGTRYVAAVPAFRFFGTLYLLAAFCYAAWRAARTLGSGWQLAVTGPFWVSGSAGRRRRRPRQQLPLALALAQPVSLSPPPPTPAPAGAPPAGGRGAVPAAGRHLRAGPVAHDRAPRPAPGRHAARAPLPRGGRAGGLLHGAPRGELHSYVFEGGFTRAAPTLRWVPCGAPTLHHPAPPCTTLHHPAPPSHHQRTCLTSPPRPPPPPPPPGD